MKPYTYCPHCATPLTTIQVEHDGERLACPAPTCDFVAYQNPTPVVAAIVQKGDDVVLVRNIGWPETWFGLVSGFLEAGETPEQGICREIEEELCVSANIIEMVGAYAFEKMNQLILVYHVEIKDKPVANPQELAGIKFVPIEKLRPWPFGTGPAVADWLNSRK